MKKKWKKKITGLKLNIKFTIIIQLFLIVPIGIMGSVIFYIMEKNVIQENVSYMQYTMERYQDNIQTNIDSINMTTQFFLSDEALLSVLNQAVTGDTMTTEELRKFYNTDIASLERLVNNNPLLYGVRVYSVNNKVQEMMPVLYQNSRMQRQKWGKNEEASGWYFQYKDRIFYEQTGEGSPYILSLTTPVTDYNNGKIGVIEAAMTMQSMFPALYENIENECSCFVTEDGQIIFGTKEKENVRKLVLENYMGTPKEEIQTVYRKTGNRHMIVSSMYIRELGGTLVSTQNITENLENVYKVRGVFITIMLILMVALAFGINLIVKHLLKQFYVILNSIRKVQKGNLDVRIVDCGNDEMGELGTQINKMLERIQQLMDDNLKRELLAKNSEIRALQNQINSHFIYNVLESIKMMAEIDEEYAISDAITSLGKLLRYSMKWVSGNVKVRDELDYIRNYLALINLRFDYEIYLSLNIPEEIMEQEIPKMSLQPIVENAIYHGIEEMAEDTNIYIKGLIQKKDCVIEITDAGRGMSEEELENVKQKIAGEIETSGGSGNGIGLKNVQDRIHIAFGEEYGISFASKLGCYTKVMVKIPFEKKYR